MLAASAADIAKRTRSTAVLEYGPTETPTLLGPMLLGFARLCRQPPPGRVRTMAENPGFSSNGRETRRETDCLLEERVSCELVSEAPAGRSSRQPRGWGPQEKRVNGNLRPL